MAFKPGNPGGAMSAGVPKPWSGESRKANRSLAMSIREGLHPDKVRDWLISVWEGKDPLDGTVVPLEARERALKILLDRGYGQAAQMLVVEGQVTTETISSAPSAARRPMTLEEINARRAALRAALPGGTVIDATSTEGGKP